MNNVKKSKLLKSVKKEFDNLPRGITGRRSPAPDSLWEQVFILSPYYKKTDLAEKLGVNITVLKRGIKKIEKTNTCAPLGSSSSKKHSFMKVMPNIPLKSAQNSTFLDGPILGSELERKRKVILELSTKSGTTITIFE
jgi:hypothetical protein